MQQTLCRQRRAAQQHQIVAGIDRRRDDGGYAGQHLREGIARAVAAIGELHDEKDERERQKDGVEGFAADIGIAQPRRRLAAVDQGGGDGRHQQEDREDEAHDGQEHLAHRPAGAVLRPGGMSPPNTVHRAADALGVCHIGHKPHADGTAPVAHSRFEDRHDTPPAPAASA